MEPLIGAMAGAIITVAVFHAIIENQTSWGKYQRIYDQKQEKENRKKDELIHLQTCLIEEQNELLQKLYDEHH